MTDRDAFLASIAAAPDDDLPRLVFADWLDDRGDADRADFIRKQIAGQPSAAPPEEWLGPLARYIYHAEYRRGMPEHLVLSAEGWLRNGERIRRIAPVRGVSLLGAGRSLNDLVAGTHLRGLNALHLTNAMLADDGVDLLARCRHLTTLTSLRLGHNDVSDVGAADLADSPFLGRLESLVLRDNGISLAGAMFLMHSKRLPRLKSLDLSANAINAEGIDVIRRSRLANAIDVDVSEQQPPIPWSRRLLAAK
ncbi:MAG: TIGR02996 domain-containing protein [Gemmataceae bacterium]